MSRPISAAYLERKLRAILGLSGSNAIPQLEDISGFLTLESDRPEWALPGGELFGWGRELSPAGGAGNFSWIALVNPANSGVVAALESIANSSANAQFEIFHNYNLTTTPLPGVGGSTTGRPRDTRAGATGTVLACLTSFGAAAGAVGDGPGLAIGNQAFNNIPFHSGPLHGYSVLGPNSAIVVRGTVSNVAIIGSIYWRERPLEGTREIK